MKKSRINSIRMAVIFILAIIAMSIISADYCSAETYSECMARITAPILDELVEANGKTSREYMCSNSTGPGGVHTCTLWLGSTLSATVPTITVIGDASTVPIVYWGTCTSGWDKTKTVSVEEDNGAIDDSENVKRLEYPRFGSRVSSLDVAKFIAGAESEEINDCETVYTRSVKVKRQHGSSSSVSHVYQTLKVKVISSDCNEGDTCDDWAPSSYTHSNKMSGTTSIDIRIKNLAGRFGGVGYGAWNDNDIFAMPTDQIAWITCYYPGVQYTYDTNVSHLGSWYGYDNSPLPSDKCEKKLREVEYKKLHNAYEDNGGVWENKYTMSGDAGSYTWSGEGGQTDVQSHMMILGTKEGDAGKTFTESATTGKPVKATITSSTPTSDWEGCYTKGTEIDWEEKKDGFGEIVYGPDGVSPILIPIAWAYDKPCSCCTVSDAAPSLNGSPPNPYYTGHVNGYEKTLYDATVVDGPVSDSLSVSLPYNFTTSTAVSVSAVEDGVARSGHEDQVIVNSVTTTVHTRWNGVTIADYATQVPNATINLYAYVYGDSSGGVSESAGAGDGDICELLKTRTGSDGALLLKQCLKLKSTSQTLNSGGYLAGTTDTIWSKLHYNAFDASAGDYMCFASSVSPHSVAVDTDMSGGDGQWAYSQAKCIVIAKKPTFQVWGSSLYSVDNIDSKYNSKVNIYKSYKSNIASKWKQLGGNNTYFYQWVEESLIIKDGITQSVSSGAAGGLNSEDATGGAGVGTGDTFCKNGSALSFANYSTTIGNLCNGGTNRIGESGINSGITNREELIEYWVGADISEGALAASNVTAGTTLNLSQPDSSVWKQIDSATGARIRYGYSNGDINISGTVPQGTTYLIQSDGVVTITSDIRYTNATMFSQIPKVVIYAKEVKILCSVDEVDAIIITGKGTSGGGEIDTCSNGGPINSEARSNQLKIFGMVITDGITLGRTYGSAANEGNMKDPVGTPSDGAAAEIFDFDSSILMWSEFMAGSNESDTLQTVYQHEIAPRY